MLIARGEEEERGRSSFSKEGRKEESLDLSREN